MEVVVHPLDHEVVQRNPRQNSANISLAQWLMEFVSRRVEVVSRRDRDIDVFPVSLVVVEPVIVRIEEPVL